MWDSRPLRLSTVCHFLPGICGLVISLPIVLARQRPTCCATSLSVAAFMALWLCHGQHMSTTVKKKKKIQFPLLFFFLYSFTLGKLSYEISAMELSCVSARFPGFDQHLAKGCTVWLKADSSYPTVFLKPYPYMVLVKPPSTIQLLIWW